MTCHDAREELSALLDDALDPGGRADVEAHLATCAECRVELSRLRATVGALRRLDPPRAPAGFVDRVVRRAQPVPWLRRAAAWLFLPLAVKLPVQAAAVGVIAGLTMLAVQRTPEMRQAARVEPAPRAEAPAQAIPDAPAPTAPPPAVPSPAGPSAARPEKSARAKSRAASTPSSAATQPEPLTRGAGSELIDSSPPVEEPAARRESREETPAPPPVALPPPQRSATASEARPQTAAPSSESTSERADVRARPVPQALRRAVGPAPAASDLAGRLVAADRHAATAAVADLVARLGGHETARRHDASDTILDLQLPAPRYDELVRGLEALGSWTPVGRPNVLPLDPPQIRLTIRIGVRL